MKISFRRTLGILAVIIILFPIGIVYIYDNRATTGEEIYCIAGKDISNAKRAANRSWAAAIILIRHYDICDPGGVGTAEGKSTPLFRMWIARGNTDAMWEFASQEAYSQDPSKRKEAQQLLLRAARLGQPDAVQDVQSQVFDVAVSAALARPPIENPPIPPEVPRKFQRVSAGRLRGYCASKLQDERDFCEAVFSRFLSHMYNCPNITQRSPFARVERALEQQYLAAKIANGSSLAGAVEAAGASLCAVHSS